MTVAEAPAKPAVDKKEYSARPWDNPHWRDRGIPRKERRYIFDCRMGHPAIAACGDGTPSHGGWMIDSHFDTKTGVTTINKAVADEKAYEAQNRVGNPWMTYEEVDSVYAWSDRTQECLRDAFFALYDLKNLTENQKLMVAGAREVFARKRPDVKKKEDLDRAKRERLEILLARRAELEPETAPKPRTRKAKEATTSAD